MNKWKNVWRIVREEVNNLGQFLLPPEQVGQQTTHEKYEKDALDVNLYQTQQENSHEFKLYSYLAPRDTDRRKESKCKWIQCNNLYVTNWPKGCSMKHFFDISHFCHRLTKERFCISLLYLKSTQLHRAMMTNFSLGHTQNYRQKETDSAGYHDPETVDTCQKVSLKFLSKRSANNYSQLLNQRLSWTWIYPNSSNQLPMNSPTPVQTPSICKESAI